MASACAEAEVVISKHDKAVLERIFNPNLPYENLDDERNSILDPDTEDDGEGVKEARELEVAGVRLAEAGDITGAVEQFNNAINLCPERASGYNNRAQALRLRGDLQGAVCDLKKAVVLSKGQGKAACQAFTQLGLIKKLQGDCEGALEDFRLAAALGGSFARQQMVAMNPYAALCNQMLSEAFTKLKNGEQ